MSNTNQSLFRGFISILSGDAGGILVGLLVTPLLVRSLGTAGYGDYAFMLSVLSVLVVATNSGISDGVRKYIAEARHPGWESSVFGFYFRLAAVFAFVAGLGIVLLVQLGFIDQIVGPHFRQYFYLLAVLVGFRQLFLTLRSSLMGLHLEHYSEPITLLRKVIFGILGVTLAVLGKGVAGVLLGHILATAIVSILAVLTLAWQIDLSTIWQRASLAEETTRELLSFNGFSVVLTLLMMSLYHVDILLLRPLTGSETTAYYRAALLVAEFVWFAPFALQMALLHSTSELWATGRLEEVSSLSSQVTRYTVALTLIITLGIASLADVFMPLYFGPDFDVAATVVLFLLPGAFGLAVARPIFAIGQAKGELRGLVVATGAAAALNLLLNLLLIPRYGMIGAAVATSIGYGSMLVFHVASARHTGFTPLCALRLTRICGAAIGTAPIVFGLSRILVEPLLALALVPPVGASVYAILILRFGVIQPAEMSSVFSRLPNQVSEPLAKLVRTIDR